MGNPSKSTGIVLAAYGSTHKRARASLDFIRARVAAAWPGLPCTEAHTSQPGSLVRALARLAGQGVRAVAVQSLHVVPGAEYGGLRAEIQAVLARGGEIERMVLGRPLMHDPEDVPRVAGALVDAIPERGPHEAVLLMAHGGLHPGNEMYESLARNLAGLDRGIHLGAMESGPGLDEIVERLKARGITRIILMPLLFAAGVHAHRDMSGPGPESWKSLIQEHGLACTAITRGAGEHEPLADIWLEHLSDALAELNLT